MAVSKLSMFLQVATGSAESNPAAVRLGGWSETWYDDVTITGGTKAAFRTLCQRRAALLPATGIVIAQRYQGIDPPTPAAIELARFPGASGLCDYPSLSLLCRVAGAGVVNTRPMYLRGIPDAQITRGEFTPSADYTAKVNKFYEELEGWNFRAEQKGVQVPIIGIEADGTVTVAEELAGAVVRARVTVNRTDLVSGGSKGGKFYIDSVTTAGFVFKLRGWTFGEASKGSIRLTNFIYPNIGANSVTQGRIVTKKVGRPFEVFRGRKSKKRGT